jgi:hypothetical protein
MLFQSPGADVLNAPDNICVSPQGGQSRQAESASAFVWKLGVGGWELTPATVFASVYAALRTSFSI